MLDLFRYLKTLPVGYSEEAVTEAAIARKVACLNNRNKQDIVCAKLFKVLEHFLVLEHLEQSPYNKTEHLLKMYKQLYLISHFQRAYTEAMEVLDRDPEQNIDTFYYRSIYIEISFNGFDALLNRTGTNDLNPLLKAMDAYTERKRARLHPIL